MNDFKKEYAEIMEHLNSLKKLKKECSQKLNGIDEEIKRELMVLKLINQKNDYSNPLYDRKYELLSLLDIAEQDTLKWEYRLKNLLEYSKRVSYK